MPSANVTTRSSILVLWGLALTAGLSLLVGRGLVTSTLAQVNQNKSASVPEQVPHSQTTTQPQSTEIKIIPKIEVYRTKPYFWSDGKDPAIITISLEATKEGNRWLFEAAEDVVFVLQPVFARFNPPQITSSQSNMQIVLANFSAAFDITNGTIQQLKDRRERTQDAHEKKILNEWIMQRESDRDKFKEAVDQISRKLSKAKANRGDSVPRIQETIITPRRTKSGRNLIGSLQFVDQ